MSEVAIEGHAAMNASGKAVMLHTRVGSYIIPLIQKQLITGMGEAQASLTNLLINLVMALVGLAFMIVLTCNYKKWFGVSVFSKKAEDE